MGTATEVVRIPRLPRIPAAPEVGGDGRQGTFERIAANVGSAMGDGMEISAANTSRGFPAARVDLGRLQAELEAGLKLFDMKLVRNRWDEDVFTWMTRFLMRWVQRCKEVRFRLARNGIHVRLQTQDDRGYYRYEFDVFPGRGHGSGSSSA